MSAIATVSRDHAEAPAVIAAASASADPRRLTANGKFLYVGGEKFWIRGTTYGTFRPASDGSEYRRDVVMRDFEQMAANGLNTVRTYTVPPRWLLDIAHAHGLRVLVGLPWEEHVTFLDDKKRARAIEDRMRAHVRACAGHAAVFGYTIGNEIPASIVRWHGRRSVEAYLARLYQAVKEIDAHGLVTYVNYPTTEYLELPFLDVVAFNVYLESPAQLDAYLARLHNVAGERPLIMAEIGLDSRRHGEGKQAQVLDWQIRTAFAAGCAGVFVFAWTDDWHRGGHDIEDWDFGLTTRDRRPKPTLTTVREAFADAPFAKHRAWPRISVVVCTYNGARTIRDCLDGLLQVEYPDFEVIVVDDGSTDASAAIASEYGYRVISTENRGLSNARNTGLEAAAGEIVAYIDDDAHPDPHWLTYLADTFMTTTHVGVGGPNIPPPGDGLVADCVANAPGAPNHVLLADRVAEHIPGCNMAFRKGALQAIAGFDPQFRNAGDDVDVCWRLQQRGWTLGFSPAALVWHHRRNSVRAYWKQQQGYGKAEALLESKWREKKYNAAGHAAWAGRMYGKGQPCILGWRRARIYQGSWGSAPFQRMYESAPSMLGSLIVTPEWYLVIAALAALAVQAAAWSRLTLVLPLLALALAAPVAQACLSAARGRFSGVRTTSTRLRALGLTALLCLIQPLARLRGRLAHGLSPWRRSLGAPLTSPRPRRLMIWSERWRAPAERLQRLDEGLRDRAPVVRHGGDFGSWDLEVWGGTLGAVRILMAIEEHGAGRQLVRFRTWPRCSQAWFSVFLVLALLAVGAAYDGAPMVCVMLSTTALVVGVRMYRDCAAAMAVVLAALQKVDQAEMLAR
jgi:GT2 family glycosyltransferase